MSATRPRPPESTPEQPRHLIEFRAFGTIELFRPDGDSLSVTSRSKALGLLAYLVLSEGGGTRRREDVCALLWPEADEAHGRNSLNQTLHSLRTILGKDIVAGGRDTVGIDLARIRCDAVEFRRAVTASDWHSALSLYGGDLLPGLYVSGAAEFERWLDRQRRDLRGLAFDAARRVADHKTSQEDHRSAIRALRRARAIRPDDDETVRILMRTCRQQGNLAAAVKEYEAYRTWLAETFDLEPPEETRKLVEEMRAANGSVVKPQPSGASASEIADGAEVRLPSSVPPISSDPGASQRRIRRVGGAAILSALCMAVLAFVLLNPRTEVVSGVRRLAVLPLQDFSPDGDKGYFTNAMTDELITALGRLGDPEVVGFNSVQVYRGGTASIQEIAGQLNVDAVIEGSATWEGQDVRVNLQLVQVNPEKHVWAQVWEGRDSALLNFQSQIAADVARRFGATTERIRDIRRAGGVDHDVDPKALEAYYRGRALWKRYRHRESMDAFLEAVSVEPNWAPPWAGLADTYVLFAHAMVPPAEAMVRARRHIERAVELNPDLERTQVTLGHYLMEGPIDWEGAERAFKRAAQLNPGYPDTYVYSGQLYMALGRYEEARTAMERAFSLDPQNPVAFTDIGKIYLVEGRYEDAIEHFRKAVEVYPEHPITRGQLVYALLAAGEWNEAIDLTRQAIADGRGLSLSLGGRNPSIAGWLAYALARSGQVEEARTIADSLADLATREYVLPLGVAAAYSGIGDRAAALDWLERMEEEGSTQRVWLLTYPAFDELRGDPRFEAMVERLELRTAPGVEPGMTSVASYGSP
jgi:DNA-binding SARP family transcriptional activator/TolB-like protein